MTNATGRLRQKEAFKVGKPHYDNRLTRPPMTLEELKAYREAQPPDDRTPMQKLMGEPPRWRSALAQVEIAEAIE